MTETIDPIAQLRELITAVFGTSKTPNIYNDMTTEQFDAFKLLCKDAVNNAQELLVYWQTTADNYGRDLHLEKANSLDWKIRADSSELSLNRYLQTQSEEDGWEYKYHEESLKRERLEIYTASLKAKIAELSNLDQPDQI